MRQLIKLFGWHLYGGVSCYCIQRFFIDFVYVKCNENELFQAGDIVVLDIWNRLKLHKLVEDAKRTEADKILFFPIRRFVYKYLELYMSRKCTSLMSILV